MKRFERGGAVVFADVEKTREYYASRTLCSCSGCKNFYRQAKKRFPELDAFLSAFGADISRPDENAWWDEDGQITYIAYYTVTGRLETAGQCELGELQAAISMDGIPNEQSGPYFVISVSGICLPWILDEPFPAEAERLPLVRRIRRFFHIRET